MRLLRTATGLLAFLVPLACSTRVLPERQDQPAEAEEYYAAKRAGAENPQARYAEARRVMTAMRRNSVGDDGEARALSASSDGNPIATWTFLGPGNIGGRTRVLLIDPGQPETMYAAAVSGGVWKTTNGGAKWIPAGDLLSNLTVNSMAMDPRNSQVIYAGTGEGYFREEVRGTGLPLRGNGIFVTRDGAHSWTQLQSTSNQDFAWVNDLVISDNDPQRIYAATRTGVWRSRDGGEEWERVLASGVQGGCLDLAARFEGGRDLILASCGTLAQATVYRNIDAGGDSSWDSVLSETNMGRTSLAFSASNPAIVYALSASNESGTNDQGLFAVFRSDQGGAAGSWTAQVRGGAKTLRPASLLLTNPISASNSVCSPGSSDQYVTMGWYCNTIAVDPRNPDIVWAAGVDLFRSNDGGRTWGAASYWWAEGEPTFVHADQHSIVFHPQYDGTANQTMFSTNDGGVFRTDNARAAVAMSVDGVCEPANSKVTFTSLNHSYGATQFYHGLPFPDGRRYLAGAQDNGTVLGNSDTRADGWKMVYGGDGAYVAVDPEDSATFYVSFQGANIAKTRDGGKTFSSARLGLNDSFLFITPYLMDPNNRMRLWTGGKQLWKTEDGAALWKTASTTLNGRVSALAVAPGNSDLVLAGTTAGDIVRNDKSTQATSTTAWTKVRPRDGWVSSLAFDPLQPAVVYATYAGFGGSHVWRSNDAGATWTSIDGTGTGTLPDIPVHSIAPDPTRAGRLFLGTDLGVFTSTDGGASWRVENTGFASVVTEWLAIGHGDRGPAVYAFTHGRGAWRAELVAPPRRRAVH